MKKSVITLYQSMAPSIIGRITISYSSSMSERPSRFSQKCYLRVGRMVVSMPLYHVKSVHRTLRAMLIAVCLFPDYLRVAPSGRSQLIRRFFAKGFYKGQAKKIYEDGPERFMFQSRSVCGNFIDFSPWRSLTTLFYPKCREFNRKSHAELLYSYTILRHVRQVFGDRPISELVDLINTSSVTEDNERIMRYFFGDRVDEYIFDDRTPSSIASELYLSKHFLEFCCSECFEWYVVQRIVEFYKYRDYCNLYMQYVQQEDMITRFPDFPDVWRFFYYNALPSFEYLPTLKNTPFYRQFVIDSRRMAEEKIKHKVLNDINLVFNLNL